MEECLKLLKCEFTERLQKVNWTDKLRNYEEWNSRKYGNSRINDANQNGNPDHEKMNWPIYYTTRVEQKEILIIGRI